MAIARALSALNETDGPLPVFIKLATALGGSILLWRLWRFTILPTFVPSEPKELPYWIPCESAALEAWASPRFLMLILQSLVIPPDVPCAENRSSRSHWTDVRTLL